MDKSFLSYVEQSVKEHWNLDALSDYQGSTLKYKDIAKGIAQLHILFEKADVKKGDKIALCGRNSSNWGVIFLAVLTYKAVCVPILHDFKADNIHHIVNHSDASLLFVGDNVWENLDESSMPNLKAIFLIRDFSLLIDRTGALPPVLSRLDRLLAEKYEHFSPAAVSYQRDQPDELAYISYTSGTTSFSKGVMIPYRSLWSNLKFAQDNMEIKPGDRHVCMLPLAHAFGLLFSFLFEFTKGCHVYFLTRLPSSKIIFQAYRQVNPTLIIIVPLIVEKIVKKNILPKLEEPKMKFLLRIPGIRTLILGRIRKELYDLFGGNFIELVIGGAALNPDVETFLQKIDFPFTIGYGMTECGPLISYASAATFVKSSCGRPVDRMEVKISSNDRLHVPGEVLVRGDNVTLGYYKDKNGNAEVFDAEGWFHTGDMAVMDERDNIFMKGRCKNMLLGANGQNIYPEEIEDLLNSFPFVAESIVVQREEKLVGLVHPDYNEVMVHGLTDSQLESVMEKNREELNEMLPRYSQISAFLLFPEEFEKTPKRSIKRFLYV
ncbi:AMP-binding protein [Phocaeicola abscessus]|uniref:AMP-binding protein n=1 Tax=Phocaeicola abscessus TaxID=555313 RepID=UPI000553D33C|nr:AMP-binding protein [Phocaeicola abscessus]